MYRIKINEAFETYGLISFNIRQEEDNLVREGILKTHLYIEEITALECDRFVLDGINVFAESFGSTDPFVVYYFTFETYDTFYEELEYEEDELIKLYNKEMNE